MSARQRRLHSSGTAPRLGELHLNLPQSFRNINRHERASPHTPLIRAQPTTNGVCGHAGSRLQTMESCRVHVCACVAPIKRRHTFCSTTYTMHIFMLHQTEYIEPYHYTHSYCVRVFGSVPQNRFVCSIHQRPTYHDCMSRVVHELRAKAFPLS